jgi:3-oxoacyl-[acyl-carrier-protein] synthase-1
LNPLAITAFTATSAVGRGVGALADALGSGRSGLVPNVAFETAPGVPLSTWIGCVAGLDATALPSRFAALDCRNHRLAWLGLQADGFDGKARDAIDRHGAERVAVLVGTSTSTIAASEAAYREHRRNGLGTAALARPGLHHLHATTAFVRDVLGTSGPCSTISTACSSSAKVFAQAARMIEVGLVDAAIVGGVDSLADSTVFGFHALGLVSTERCRPFDRRRDGINVGEAAGYALLERFDPSRHADVPLLAGYGESSDAHHLSAPHPEGRGARQAMHEALRRAGVGPTAIDYINLHGTATPMNDAVEAAAVASLFDSRTSVGSTKGWTGHALGAAGIVEAVVCLLALREGHVPGTLGCTERDPAIGLAIDEHGTRRPVGLALSNAFAFGGNNCVLAFARDAGTLSAACA